MTVAGPTVEDDNKVWPIGYGSTHSATRRAGANFPHFFVARG